MSKLPDYIKQNIAKDKEYYSLYSMSNIERCKIDPSYLGEVIQANEDLVWHSIHKYVGKPEVIAKSNGIDKSDVYQLGVMGLLKAIHAFDTTRGIKFSSFAVTAIYREVRCYIRDSSNILRLSRTANSLLNDIRKLEGDLGYLPSTSEIASLLNVEETKVTKVLLIGKPVKYLDETVARSEFKVSDSFRMSDLLEDCNTDVECQAIDKIFMEDLLKNVRHGLNALEFKVLIGLLNGLNQAQISEKYTISNMKVSRSMKRIHILVQEYLNRPPQ
jgi:RNA polymerase sigma factor (sigma-70 family)